jgi:hypothetical protein
VTFATDKRRRAFTPFARATVFSKLVELAHGAQEAATPVAGTGVAASAGNGATAAPDSSGTASSGGGAPNAPQRPQDWDEIGIGSLVLAHEGPEDGWWESIVIGVNGESLSLKWRDWDPYGEHDFGAVELGPDRLFWKVDYYDQALTNHSPDPADATATKRVLTIMLAEEY